MSMPHQAAPASVVSPIPKQQAAKKRPSTDAQHGCEYGSDAKIISATITPRMSSATPRNFQPPAMDLVPMTKLRRLFLL
jgi:hypothetical protein